MDQVACTDEFADWYETLDEADQERVAVSVNLLGRMGVALPFPYSSAIKGSEYPLRELRCQSGGAPLRIIYAFNPVRQSVLIIGGDKTGDPRFYEWIVPAAEKLWKQYTAEKGWKTEG